MGEDLFFLSIRHKTIKKKKPTCNDKQCKVFTNRTGVGGGGGIRATHPDLFTLNATQFFSFLLLFFSLPP